VHKILAQGAEKARDLLRPNLNAMRKAVGVSW